MARTATRHLIVGWSRGGLGHTVELLRAAGQDVGQTFDHTTSVDNLEDRLTRARSYEVSPFLVPFLNHPQLKDLPVTFVLRDPMRILNSLYHHGAFHLERVTPVYHAARFYLPRLMYELQGRPAQAGVAYLINWLELARRARPRLRVVRLEDGPRALLTTLTGQVPQSVPFCPPDTHASYCKQMIRPGDLPQPAQNGILNLLLEYGYRESAWIPRGGHAHYVNPDWHC